MGNKMENITNNKFWLGLLTWAKKDFIIVFVCLVCLLACLYTVMTIQAYQNKINDIWLQQWEESGCMAKPYMPNVTFNIKGVYT